MRTTRTYYEILGLPRDATLAQIRRRYKQLVRKYHPDVAADKKTAHRLFIQINEAYKELSDPMRRRAYDATLIISRPLATGVPGRTTTATGPARPRTAPASSVAKHVKDARWSFIQRRFSEAANHCREALEIDPHHAPAFVILGDALRAQGKINAAIKYYGYALQYNPGDRDTERKMDRLVSKRVAPARARSRVPAGQATSMTINFVWWGIAFFLIMLIWVHTGEPILWLRHYIPQVRHWSWNMVGLMAAASAVVGMLLSINGALSSPDEELIYEGQGSSWAIIPTGIILLIGSGFFFLGAAAFYIVAGLLQGSLSRSVLIVFAAVAGVVLLVSVVCGPAARYEVMLFGGNVSFLSMLFGWYVGSMFKPLSSY